MEIVPREHSDASVVSGVKCPRCGKLLAKDAFAVIPTLHDSRHPWCIECCEASFGDAEATLDKRAAYQRSYMRRRRELDGSRIQWLTVVVPGRGKMLVRWSTARNELRVTGGFGMREEALRVLTGAFCVPIGDVVESGRGGGRGFRRQKTFSTMGPVGRAEWDAGKALLLQAGAAREGKR